MFFPLEVMMEGWFAGEFMTETRQKKTHIFHRFFKVKCHTIFCGCQPHQRMKTTPLFPLLQIDHMEGHFLKVESDINETCMWGQGPRPRGVIYTVYTILDSYILSLLENQAFSSIKQIVNSSSCFGSSWTLTCLFSKTREMYSRRWNQTPQCWSDPALWRLKLGTESLSFSMVNLYPHGRRELWELTFAMKCPSGQNIELYHILLFSWYPIFCISEAFWLKVIENHFCGLSMAQHSCLQASGCP